jgi:hypothetical protein
LVKSRAARVGQPAHFTNEAYFSGRTLPMRGGCTGDATP